MWVEICDRLLFNLTYGLDWTVLYVFVVVDASYLAAVSRVNDIHGVVVAMTGYECLQLKWLGLGIQ